MNNTPAFPPLAQAGAPVAPTPSFVQTRESEARLRKMVDRHYDAVFRAISFAGVEHAFREDATQQVFCVAARKLGTILPGAELAYLLTIAWRVASEARRSARRRPVAASGDVDVDDLAGSCPSPEHLLDQKRARAELEVVLSLMPADLRAVFVLYEMDDLSLPEIAKAVSIPVGTAASRLRKAREEFHAIVKRRTAAATRMAHGESK